MIAQVDPVDATHSGNFIVNLENTFREVAEEHKRLNFLKSLNKKGLCTRNVLAFIAG